MEAKCDRDGVTAGCNACDHSMTWSASDPTSIERREQDPLRVPTGCLRGAYGSAKHSQAIAGFWNPSDGI